MSKNKIVRDLHIKIYKFIINNIVGICWIKTSVRYYLISSIGKRKSLWLAYIFKPVNYKTDFCFHYLKCCQLNEVTIYRVLFLYKVFHKILFAINNHFPVPRKLSRHDLRTFQLPRHKLHRYNLIFNNFCNFIFPLN